MTEFGEASPGERVLDGACGTGIVARELVARIGTRGEVIGCDSNVAMLATARKVAPDIDWREGNALDLPFQAASFDLVTEFKGAEPNGTYLSAFVREQGTCIIKVATRSPYVAQRNTGKRSSMKPIPGLRCAASRLRAADVRAVVAESGLK